jgi:hypothetical protein
MEVYNVHQALKILKEYYITDSIQMVTRWIREGKIKAERSENRKEGYKIHHEDLFEFIEELRPGLPEIMAVHEWYVENAFSPMVNDNYEKNSEFDSTEVKDVNTHSQELLEQLLEEKKKLENQLISIQDELNLVYGKVAELTTEVQKLKEENAFLADLYEQTDEMYQELKNKSQQESSNGTPKTMERNLIKTMSKEDFKNVFKEISKEYENKGVELSNQENELINELYSLFFQQDETLKDEVIEDEQYHCPLTGKKYKSLKPMIKNAIKIRLEEIYNEGKETVLAND